MTRLIILTIVLGFTCSCVQAPVSPPEISFYFYVTPQVTYLLDSPNYEANVLGPLYCGDKVERMDFDESNWWRVTLLRSGQTGWVRKELLSANPVSSVFYFVKEDTVPLLECPRSDCLSIQLLFRGDGVQRIEEGDQGWWRVLVIRSRSLGWVPAAALTERIEETRQKQVKMPYYYVALERLSLRVKPSNRSEVVRPLHFNDQVQKLEETDGWFKVRHPSSGALGWVISRDLEILPLIVPRGVPAKKQLKPFRQRGKPEMEPEFM